ncbi:transposable element Tcb2 transposase [Trichonephila clavipes]|nr:transposable element Tcb2 transposase [Trichonephila clavipes]
MGAEFLFMDDNARPHRANIIDGCLQSEDITRSGTIFLETGSAGRRPGQGRRRATMPNEDRYLVLTARRHRNMNATLLQQHLRSATGTTVSTQNVRNRLHGVGLYARRPMVCVRLTSRHRCDRREWAAEHVNWRRNEWSNVLFSDESRFSVHPDNRRIFIWRDRGSRNTPALVHKSVSFGGGGVLVYGGISIDGRTDLYIIRGGPLTARQYRDEILRPIVVPYAAAIGDDFILMDDNCRPHCANLVEDFLFEEGIVRMEWPACSPDTNPIQHVWEALGIRVAGHQPPPKTLQELERALLEEWDRIPQLVINSLIDSMPQRTHSLLNQAHEQFGHPGVQKMLNLISLQYYGPNITTDISEFVKHCTVCQVNKKRKQKKFGLLQQIPPTSKPFEFVFVETVGGFNYYNSTKKNLHNVIDPATRYVWVFPSKNENSETYANILKQVFQIQIPEKSLTDRNGAFTSSRFKKFLRNYNIKHLLTTAHPPQTNGKNERVHPSLVTRLKCKVNASSTKIPWTKLLDQVCNEYNSTPHSITKYPPAYLLFGLLPYQSPIDQNNYYEPVDEARELALQRTIDYHIKNKIRYDARCIEKKINPGDLVVYEEFQYPIIRGN